ncbi:MAG: diphosphatase [Frankiales bacterium]|nr:diphosphatase [Frankiales bacterium]
MTSRASQRPIPVPLLSRSAHDRVAHRRTDEAWLAQAWSRPETRVLVLTARSRVLVDAQARLQLVSPAEADAAVGADAPRMLLGEADGRAYFAVFSAGPDEPEAPTGLRRADLRELGGQLNDLDVGLLTASVALQAWHRTHTHCPRCGSPTAIIKAGWTRACPVDGSEHFPRTDPAVIMLIRDAEDRCLLARGPAWPVGRMSVLAGFVEAGESAEAAVVREVAEEVGVEVVNVQYVASQPHPFPASLMLGYTGEAAGTPELAPDNDEILDAGWFTRDEVRAARDWGDEASWDGAGASAPSGASLQALPPTFSIARQLIDAWLAEAE